MDLKLEIFIVVCPVCKGLGEIEEGGPSYRTRKTCAACAGQGERLTEQGKVLKQFLEKARSLQ